MRNVIIPMIIPPITICTFLTLNNSPKLLDQGLALTNDASQHATKMVALSIIDIFFSKPGYEGVGQAEAVVFLLIVVLVAFSQLCLTHSKRVES